MREILFRGKCFNTEEWVEGYLGIEVPDELVIQQFSYDEYFKSNCIDQYSVKPETIGQYTGLTDKNGTKIFEGDILHVEQCGETGSRISSVHFGEYIDADSVFDNYRCIVFYVKTSDGCCTIGALLSEEFECEVIGNIYDNPELMGEGGK